MKHLRIATAMAISALAMGQPASARMLHHHYAHSRGYSAYGAYGSGDAYRVGAQRGLKRLEPAYMYRQDQGVKRGD
jgi:hypothetical protein